MPVEKKYTYDPNSIMDGGIDQMRFELGDTVVDMGELSSPLCDQEYQAILKKHGHNWRMARYVCLKAIVMKLSYEVNTSVGGLSYSLAERYKNWKAMLDEEKKSLNAVHSVPRAKKEALMPPGPYFYNDMMANPRRF